MHAIKRRPPVALPLLSDAELASDVPGPERTAAAREGLALLDQLLAELRPKRRSAFVLHVLEGHSIEEVAAILNASTAAVKVRIHDARRHIERIARNPALVAALAGGAMTLTCGETEALVDIVDSRLDPRPRCGCMRTWKAAPPAGQGRALARLLPGMRWHQRRRRISPRGGAGRRPARAA
jgi:hypothetical protein